MTTKRYVFEVLGVEPGYYDGDTFRLRIDRDFYDTSVREVRLLGFDAPELRKGTATERLMGRQAATFTLDWLTKPRTGGTMWLRTEKDPDDFGRWLGDVWWESDDGEEVEHLGEALYRAGLDVVWPKRWHEVHPE